MTWGWITMTVGASCYVFEKSHFMCKAQWATVNRVGVSLSILRLLHQKFLTNELSSRECTLQFKSIFFYVGHPRYSGESIWHGKIDTRFDSMSLAYQSHSMVYSTRVDLSRILRGNVYSLCRNIEQITLTMLSKLLVC